MRLPTPPSPFILLDDARVDGAAPARLYRDPVEIICATNLKDVQPALDRVAEARDAGLHVAGYMSYEAAFALDDHWQVEQAPLQHHGQSSQPLLWFGLFDGCRTLSPAEIDEVLPPPGDISIGPVEPSIDETDYARAFATVQGSIRAGDIYQANLTFPCSVPLRGHPLQIYSAIRPRAAAGYGGIIYTGQQWLLSFSPELFFTLVRGQLTARPMKGTARRKPDPSEDLAAADRLRLDPKQQAENLMIVDLLRNDLSRVSSAGSVRVPDLFKVESYPTVHQMISTVRSKLLPGLSAVDVLRTIFPCGSITGAPKFQAMAVIRSIEAAARGAYTGTIGRIDPDGNAAFNVAIRTLAIADGADVGYLGLGSGVVADSNVNAEWRECLDKGRFVVDDGMETAACPSGRVLS